MPKKRPTAAEKVMARATESQARVGWRLSE
jgi:hypothetical protein